MKWLKRLWYRIRLKLALSFIQDLDETMKKAGWPRAKRRQTWREFVKGNRKTIVKYLKEMGNEDKTQKR